MDSGYLENYVCICAPVNDLDQGVVFLGISFYAIRYFILWQFKTLFGDGLINFNKFFLKTLRLATLRRLGSSFFHLMAIDGKKEFWKKLCLLLNRAILSVFLVL